MNKHTCFTAILISTVFPAQIVSAQGVYDIPADEAQLADVRTRIARTAEAMGISIYEYLPVIPDSAFNNLTAGSSAAGAAAVSRPAPLRMPPLTPAPVPTPEQPGQPRLPPGFSLPEPISYWGTAVTVWYALGAQISDNAPWSKTPTFEQISERVAKASISSAFPARKAGQPSLFTDAGFVKELEQVTGSAFVDGNSVRFLIDGGEAFRVKDDLIKNAKKSLLISSWAFYDDITGYETARMLIDKKKQGLEIKIMVDRKVISGHGKKVIKMMENAGIEVLRYQEAGRSNDYWHVKIIIADDKHAVVGGMNFGDVYSHKDPNNVKWRDTDALYSGPAALATRELFAGLWNEKAGEAGLRTIASRPAQSPAFDGGSARVAVVLQNPPQDSPILISIIKAMYGATRNINIENAYFVALPVVSKAVLDARARGVEVNILTNSKESIDPEGKVIVDAVYKCLVPLTYSGANIYLYNGDTLHSKFMTVDGIFADIGSYNLHPRGERYDTEVNINIMDPVSVAQLDQAFHKDLAGSRLVKSAAELGEKPGWLSTVVSEYFYAQLGRK